MSCDNIPANGVILGQRRAGALPNGAAIASPTGSRPTSAFPSTMVDRIVPATSRRPTSTCVEQRFGYRDRAVVVGEPFRQWVIENDFAGRVPRWDLVGAELRRRRHAVTSISRCGCSTAPRRRSAYLGVLAGLEHTFDAVADPLLAAFVRRMLCRGDRADAAAGARHRSPPPMSSRASAGCATPRSATATTRSPPTARRRSCSACSTRSATAARASIGRELLAVPVAGWMAYLLRARTRFGERWPEGSLCRRGRRIADATGPDAAALARRIVALEPIFAADLAADEAFCARLARHLGGLLLGDPRRHLGALLAEAVAA